MAGERRRKTPANDTRGRAAPRGASRAATGERERPKAKVIPLPQGRRPGRSGPPPERGKTKRAAGQGRLRLVVGVVALICLSLGVRAVQLSIADNERHGTFATEAHADERPDATEEAGIGRGAIVSADGQRLAASL